MSGPRSYFAGGGHMSLASAGNTDRAISPASRPPRMRSDFISGELLLGRSTAKTPKSIRRCAAGKLAVPSPLKNRAEPVRVVSDHKTVKVTKYLRWIVVRGPAERPSGKRPCHGGPSARGLPVLAAACTTTGAPSPRGDAPRMHDHGMPVGQGERD